MATGATLAEMSYALAPEVDRLDRDQATAIGARTEECTGDGALGVERIDRVLEDYTCLARAGRGARRRRLRR